MEIGAILFSLAMLLLVAAYVLQPLSTYGRGGSRDTSRELSALQAERDRILDSIQEIDMDRTMGKVAEEDYQRQRGSLALEGAEILRSIDELQQDGVPDEAAMELEAAVAELRGKSSSSSMELEEAATEPRSKSSNLDSQIAKADAQGTCPTCGEVIHPSDRFCSNCGETLEEQVA
jgi:hypothetical protein